jgi:DNA-binding MarR family transcriptional regulator
MPQDSLGFLMADVVRLIRRAFKERLKGSSLTLAQARTLLYVSRHEGIRQVELAELLEVQPITLVRLLDQLVAARVVERRRDPRDRRAYRIHLRPAAQAHLAAIERVAAQIRADALRGVSAQQADQMSRTLLKMRENLGPR